MKEYAVKMSRRQLGALGAKRVKECFLAVNSAVNAVKNGVLSAEGALVGVNARLAFGFAEN